MKRHLLSLLLIIVTTIPLTAKDVVVWDLGYTLIRPSRSVLQNLIGIGDYFFYSIFNGRSSDDLQDRVFEILEEIDGAQTETPLVLTNSGRSLPKTALLWQTGIKRGSDILNEACAIADRRFDAGLFCSATEYQLTKNALSIMLDEQILAKSMKPIKKGLKLMRKLAEAGVEQYILSNWDPHSFKALIEKDSLSEIFSIIPVERITISGECGFAKPQKDIFHQFCTKHALNPDDCIFIDDQPENCDAAKTYGMKAIQLTNKDYKAVQKELTALKLLS